MFWCIINLHYIQLASDAEDQLRYKCCISLLYLKFDPLFVGSIFSLLQERWEAKKESDKQKVQIFCCFTSESNDHICGTATLCNQFTHQVRGCVRHRLIPMTQWLILYIHCLFPPLFGLRLVQVISRNQKAWPCWSVCSGWRAASAEKGKSPKQRHFNRVLLDNCIRDKLQIWKIKPSIATVATLSGYLSHCTFLTRFVRMQLDVLRDQEEVQDAAAHGLWGRKNWLLEFRSLLDWSEVKPELKLFISGDWPANGGKAHWPCHCVVSKLPYSRLDARRSCVHIIISCPSVRPADFLMYGRI